MKFTVEKAVTTRKVSLIKTIEADTIEEALALAKASDYEFFPESGETYELNVRPVQQE